MSIRIADVAQKAGVSQATVSRVLNGSDTVTARTRSKVMKVIHELDYQPNAAAKNLRSQKTMTIGVIVPDVNNAYYAEVIKGIANVAYARKYKIIICDTENNKDKEFEFVNLLMNRTIDGLVMVTPNLLEDEIKQVAAKGYSLAVIGKDIQHERIPCAFTNNVKFSIEVIRHLVERGHRDIVFLSGYADAVDSMERLEGYMKGLKEHELPFRPEYVEDGNFSEEGGYDAIKRLMDSGLPFTAVYAANDEMALGVYKACKERGVRIPEDLAVVGVDNNRIGSYILPGLSTVDQPKYEMGAVIVEKLIDLMNTEDGPGQRIFEIPSQLIIRGSSDYRRGE
ncbi:LacI family DNA-binding transcriptional regulator [Paenibacillus athensensis]|uniref:LacI family transcriptional regulator n=1 Tax=Paenibacillus athensensis TaxID=1967502 RepID=A0A4Y8Q020_9BACL|nr:LacI family DNA-binding transcriptional regulator [Paenibacillus athensensis]MCD1260438.1 LacI family DNA-binding transcriptional regulator [Paenibacillus athensensis]